MLTLAILWFVAVSSLVVRRTATMHIHHNHASPVRSRSLENAFEAPGHFECTACRDRRRVVRYATIGIVSAMVLAEFLALGSVHWPDAGFLALVFVTELT